MTTSTTTASQTQRSFRLAGEEQIKPADQDTSFQSLARGTRDGALKLRGIPTFSDPPEQRKWMKEHMAAAFRYFGKLGYGEGVSGHISMRGMYLASALKEKRILTIIDPILKDHFWMNPFAKHFSTIKASDLVLVDDEGYVTEGGAQIPINEAGFMIHSEIHKARPDVIAAAHTHGIHGKTWSAFGKNIEMLTQGNSASNSPYISADRLTCWYQDACNLFGRVGVYEDHGGIALSQDEGRQIAAALGKDNIACILQNHG